MDRSATPLPFSSPRWLTPKRIALAAVAAFASSATLPAIWWIDDARHEIGNSRAAMCAVVLSTIGLSLALVWRALRATTMEKTVLWCVLGAIPLGVLNAGFSLAGVGLVTHVGAGPVIGGFFLGALVGGIYGGPIGLGFGSAYAIIAASAIRAAKSPSHDSVDRVLVVSGLWLALASVAVIELCPEVPSIISPLFTLALGVASAGLAVTKLIGRARWLRRVSKGLDQAFRIEPRSGAASELALLPVMRSNKTERLEGVVTRRPAASGLPYRETPHGTPVALTELPHLL